MQVQFGIDAGAKRRNEILPVMWDSQRLANAHTLITGMSGAGKTHLLRGMIRSCLRTNSDRPVRIHVFDVHGDIEIEGASSVLFSEQTEYGLNPLRVNPDPHFGGLRKRVQGFIGTMNKVMTKLGGKQEAALRNILYDVYAMHGFSPDDSATWRIDESNNHLFTHSSANRLYLDIPKSEKDLAKQVAEVMWDGREGIYCWWIDPANYHGAITRWKPKTMGRTHPSIMDALRHARRVLEMSFLGADEEAITHLEIFNRRTRQYQNKVLERMRRGGVEGAEDEKAQEDLDKAAVKAIESFTKYVESIKTGRELADVMKYDSTDVLKSVVDRLENLNAIGVFKSTPPPFDPSAPVWRYDLRALSLTERKLFVLFRLEELFAQALERGEQSEVTEIVILDEAHLFVDDDPENILNTIAKESRKFGMGLVCASQSPTHFPEDFISSVATKVILGIDESYWRSAATKMNVPEEAIRWVRLQQSMLVQLKEKGQAKNDWRWTLIQRG